jgi:hypothetical protein
MFKTLGLLYWRGETLYNDQAPHKSWNFTRLSSTYNPNSMTHSPEINCIDPLLRVSAQGMQSDEN